MLSQEEGLSENINTIDGNDYAKVGQSYEFYEVFGILFLFLAFR